MIVEEIVGRFVAASNVTLLGRSDGRLVVYKPTAGNRPLWDFDAATLAEREVLTYRVSEAAGLGVVPHTALGDGPLGPGAVQWFVEGDDTFDPVELVQRADASVWPVALLDIVTNNADRKAGHLLRDPTGRLWAIDHGLTFHPDAKLRTVLWALAGAEVPEPLREAITKLGRALQGGLGDEITDTLGRAETQAFSARLEALAARPIHPFPPDDRPPLPWPPV